MHLATCPNSWGVWYAGDEGNIPWEAFLDGVAAIGFEYIEAGPFAYLPTDPDQLKGQLDSRGLSVIAGQVHGNLHEPDAWAGLEKQTRHVSALVSAVGAQLLLVIGGGSVNHVTNERVAPPQLTDPQWRTMVQALERMGRISQNDYGLRLVFHPTIDGFCETSADQTERLLGDTDPNYVSLCPDTGQFFYRNGDPLPFIKKHADRIRHIHFKDIVPDIHAKLAQKYIPFSQRFCPIGDGEVDFPPIAGALSDLNYQGFAVIDEDQYGAAHDHLARVSAGSFQRLSANAAAGSHN